MIENKEMIYKVFEEAIKRKASDIHLTNNSYPILRVNGVLTTLKEGFEVNTKELLAEQVKIILKEVEIKKFVADKSFDSSMSYGGSRFRVHIYKQSDSDAFSLRLIPTEMPKLKELNLPQVLKNFINFQNGLVLITGTTGSGKSTTLASLVDMINETQNKHIITVEDPIEFVHSHNKCIINQRQIGSDVKDFPSAVRDAMREDPDILLLGEMRDLETISQALTMAETGHLVFATLHTKSVAETVDRIIDIFPPEQQPQVRVQLASSLKGVLSQSLVPKIKGGRVAVCEIMLVDDAIRNMIRKGGSVNEIVDSIQANSLKNGGQTKVQAMVKLYKEKLIEKETALQNATEEEKVTFLRQIAY